ncbi:hypothetical protein [Pseudomonas aeruginosa]|uniref:hypothetical protein n=1 Tax=Pseudomonas aeruginosa TaxID=287 RepID=UPI0009A9393B|nr:hypothetical protein [Pseudomonas aeruginosa]MBN1011034.1 hypothetical protein [Pseudomonas aeruginosa]MCS7821926.1 hypothetical protein [Pseudomonas aeruginosa]WPM33362.1 hypothetical protein N8A97_18865 [Pseudomonas aeruginosa]HBO4818373.1 hypothetical protein [Pseudomonas aeruginosa]HEK0719582.1 hypothetical protein [Pseudomonas aeruginosa]
MCNFQRGTYECRGDGYLWDADNDGWDPDDESWPCPGCNTLEYLTIAKEESESCSFFVDCGDSGTGEDIWRRKLNWALGANPEETERVLKILGPIHCLVHDKTSPDGFIVSINNV